MKQGKDNMKDGYLTVPPLFGREASPQEVSDTLPSKPLTATPLDFSSSELLQIAKARSMKRNRQRSWLDRIKGNFWR